MTERRHSKQGPAGEVWAFRDQALAFKEKYPETGDAVDSVIASPEVACDIAGRGGYELPHLWAPGTVWEPVIAVFHRVLSGGASARACEFADAVQTLLESAVAVAPAPTADEVVRARRAEMDWRAGRRVSERRLRMLSSVECRLTARSATLRRCAVVSNSPRAPRTRERRSTRTLHGAARRSSARSGDGPGDAGGESDPDHAGSSSDRLCACGCGESLDAYGLNLDAKYLNSTHRVRDFRRKKRPDGAAGSRVAVYDERDPYFVFPGPGECGMTFDALVAQAVGGCRCESPIVDPSYGDCIVCGRRVARTDAYGGRRTFVRAGSVERHHHDWELAAA